VVDKVTKHVVEGRGRSGLGWGLGRGPEVGVKKTNIPLFAENTIQERKWEEISSTIESFFKLLLTVNHLHTFNLALSFSL
jgi:hypothetical protein